MSDRDDFAELERLGDELRQQVGGEFRRTAEEDEYAAAKAQIRARSLENVAFELLSRGDAVAVTIGGAPLQGTVIHAKGDLMALQTPHGDRIDVHLGAHLAIHVLERSTAGGRSRDRHGAESFVARLRELELEATPVVLTTPPAGGSVIGVIEAVTSDHVMLNDPESGTWYLPLAAIAAVTAR